MKVIMNDFIKIILYTFFMAPLCLIHAMEPQQLHEGQGAKPERRERLASILKSSPSNTSLGEGASSDSKGSKKRVCFSDEDEKDFAMVTCEKRQKQDQEVGLAQSDPQLYTFSIDEWRQLQITSVRETFEQHLLVYGFVNRNQWIMEKALKQGASFSKTYGAQKRSLLHIAVLFNDQYAQERIQAVLDVLLTLPKRTQRRILTMQDKCGNTALHYAKQQGVSENIEALVQAEVCCDRDGNL
jgi:hypothetical protein